MLWGPAVAAARRVHARSGTARPLNFDCVLWSVLVIGVVCTLCVLGLFVSSSVGLVRSVASTQVQQLHEEVSVWESPDVMLWLNATQLCAVAPFLADVSGQQLLDLSTDDLMQSVTDKIGAVEATSPVSRRTCQASTEDVSGDGDGDGDGPSAEEDCALPVWTLPCMDALAAPDPSTHPDLPAALIALRVWHRTLLRGMLPSGLERSYFDYWTTFRQMPVAVVLVGFGAFEHPRLLLLAYMLGDIIPEALVPAFPHAFTMLNLPVIGHPLLLPLLLYNLNPQLCIFAIGWSMLPNVPASFLLAAIQRSFVWCMFLRGLLNIWLWGVLFRAPPLNQSRAVLPPVLEWTSHLSSRELKAAGWLAFATWKFLFFATLSLGVFTATRFLRPLLFDMHVSVTLWFVVFAHLIMGLCFVPFIANIVSHSYTPSPFMFFESLAEVIVSFYLDGLQLMTGLVLDIQNIPNRVFNAAFVRVTRDGQDGPDPNLPPPPPEWTVGGRTGTGYPKFLFGVLPASVIDELTCPICCEIVCQAVEIQVCGHLFCRTCLQTSLQHQTRCPVCREVFTVQQVHAAQSIRRMLLGFDVGCPAMEAASRTQVDLMSPPREGAAHCAWRGPLQSLETHAHVFDDDDLKSRVPFTLPSTLTPRKLASGSGSGSGSSGPDDSDAAPTPEAASSFQTPVKAPSHQTDDKR